MGHGDTNARKAFENGAVLDASGKKFVPPSHGSIRQPYAPAGPKIDVSRITAVLMDATILILHILSGLGAKGTSVKRIATIFANKIAEIYRMYPNVTVIELFADVTDRTPLTKSIEQQTRAVERKRMNSEDLRILRESETGLISSADAVYATKCKIDKTQDARTIIFERLVPFLEAMEVNAVLDGFQHHGDTGGRMCSYNLRTKAFKETHFNGENDTRMVHRAHVLFREGHSVLICSTDTDMYAAACLNAIRDHPDVAYYRENPVALSREWEHVQDTSAAPEGSRSRLFMNRAPGWPTDPLRGVQPSPYENRFLDLCVMYAQMQTTGEAESAYAYLMWGGNDLCKSMGEHIHNSTWGAMETIVRPLFLNMAVIRHLAVLPESPEPIEWPGKLPVCIRVSAAGEADIDEDAMCRHVRTDPHASHARVRRTLLAALYYTVYPWMEGDVEDRLDPFGVDDDGVTIYGFERGRVVASYASIVSPHPPAHVSHAGLVLGDAPEDPVLFSPPPPKKRKAESELPRPMKRQATEDGPRISWPGAE